MDHPEVQESLANSPARERAAVLAGIAKNSHRLFTTAIFFSTEGNRDHIQELGILKGSPGSYKLTWPDPQAIKDQVTSVRDRDGTIKKLEWRKGSGVRNSLDPKSLAWLLANGYLSEAPISFLSKKLSKSALPTEMQKALKLRATAQGGGCPAGRPVGEYGSLLIGWMLPKVSEVAAATLFAEPNDVSSATAMSSQVQKIPPTPASGRARPRQHPKL